MLENMFLQCKDTLVASGESVVFRLRVRLESDESRTHHYGSAPLRSHAPAHTRTLLRAA